MGAAVGCGCVMSALGIALFSVLGSRWGWVGSGVGALVGMLVGFVLGQYAGVMALSGIGATADRPTDGREP